MDQVEISYQPTVDLRTVRVIGVEATPSLPETSANGHVRRLTERALELAVRAAGDWWRSGLELQLSMRLPQEVFAEPKWKLDAFITRTLADHRLPAEALRLEVTEQTLLHPQADQILTRLHRLGAALSVDDFGTGQFSIRRLVELPVDELRIDRSFLVEPSGQDTLIVRSTIHLAHQIGLQVVAKGVGTEEAWRQLRSMGCERAQGPVIAEPLSAREVPAWLASWNQRARQLSSARRVQGRKNAAQGREKAPA